MKIFFANRRFLIALLLLAAVGAGLAAWAFLYEPNTLTIHNYRIAVPELDSAFDNFKIVAISDVHGGSNFVDATKIRRVRELANAENADLIVLLGDFVAQQAGDHTSLKMPMAAIADSLQGLKAKDGVFAVIGNHDLWYGEQKVQAELERVGITVLNSAAVKIERANQSFILLGLPEILQYGSREKFAADAGDALAKLGDAGDAPIIALVHNPDAFAWMHEKPEIYKNFRLVFAGHTHGGQCDFPVVGSPIVPSSYGQKYAKGLIEENGRQLFVTTGVGTSILPARFRVPPEIAVITVDSER